MKRANLLDCASIRLPSVYGHFHMMSYEPSNSCEQPTVVLIKGDVRKKNDVLVRFHSECFTGDILGSLRCDCRFQLERSLQMIEDAGLGVMIYLRQEGRGIGLINKLKAYRLQEQGYDTVEANELLHLPVDAREYDICRLILEDLDVESIRLMTNNPEKIDKALKLGIKITERITIEAPFHQENRAYMLTKKMKMGHLLHGIPAGGE